jgi:hypothetical protein
VVLRVKGFGVDIGDIKLSKGVADRICVFIQCPRGAKPLVFSLDRVHKEFICRVYFIR